MDSSVTPVRHGGLSLVQTTDFFYPLVDDPYMMGKKEKVENTRNVMRPNQIKYKIVKFKCTNLDLYVNCVTSSSSLLWEVSSR